jgi:hypothetical protein
MTESAFEYVLVRCFAIIGVFATMQWLIRWSYWFEDRAVKRLDARTASPSNAVPDDTPGVPATNQGEKR